MDAASTTLELQLDRDGGVAVELKGDARKSAIETIKARDVVAAELLRIEARRFDLKGRERLVVDALIDFSVAQGRAGVRVGRNWAALADAICQPRNHVGAVIAGGPGRPGLKGLRVVALTLDDEGIEVGLNCDFESWGVRVLCDHKAHWQRQNEFRRDLGCTEWLWAEEQDLAGALALTHRERWEARAASICGNALRVSGAGTGCVSRCDVVPISGTVPEMGSALQNKVSGAEVGFARVNIDGNAPIARRVDFGRPRARARAVKQKQEPITVQQLNGARHGDESSRLIEALEVEFARVHGPDAARKEMINSGGCWRMVARRWPDEFEAQVGGLRAHLNEGGKIDTAAWFYFQYYFRRAVGCTTWAEVAEKSRNLLKPTT